MIREEPKEEPEAVRRSTVLRAASLDTDVPAAGGGRSFYYEWELRDRQLQQQINEGGGGGSGVSYVHYQSVPAATWVIDHHMDLIPNVLVLDENGQQMIAEVRHPSDQTTLVVHSAPYSGTAYLRS